MIGTHFSRNRQLRKVGEAVPHGFGVYETLKLRDGVLFFPEEHSERLLRSAAVIDLPHAMSAQEIVQGLDDLIARNAVTDANIRVVMLGSGDASDVYMYLVNPVIPPRESFRDGVKVITYEGQRANPQAKTLNADISARAYAQARENGAYDALLVNGMVFEGTRTNVFFTDDERLYTPPTEMVLDGVTRRHVLHLAAENGVEVVQEPILSRNIPLFSGGFLTSTSSKVMPIAQVDSETFMIPNLVRTVQGAYDRFLRVYAHERNQDASHRARPIN